ncbi:hypothetical protein [Agreia bicolorata]|uniref:hypothetical protein n=1 Tax=Agreia bicolorata TaxID=110935 RepID=UPI000696E6FE|nr:hypothetical protein [Agreia bicolorata]
MLGSMVAAPSVAGAEPLDRTQTAESALGALGLLSPVGAEVGDDARALDVDSAQQSSASLSLSTGLTVQHENRTVSITPGADTTSAQTGASGSLIYGTDGSYDYAFTGPGHALNAGYAVINDASAPTEYRFNVAVDGAPATLELTEGSVAIKDAAGTTVNVINPAWAVDASGASISTSFSLDGSTLVQHVEHAGAAYPVVADPSLACDIAWCTVMFDKTETKTASASLAAAGALLCGSAAVANVYVGAACTAYAAVFFVASVQADNSGQCVGARFLRIGGSLHPVIQDC